MMMRLCKVHTWEGPLWTSYVYTLHMTSLKR